MSSFTVINPATAEPLREVPRASVAEVDAAIARAVRAQRSWAALPPLGRADALQGFARAEAMRWGRRLVYTRAFQAIATRRAAPRPTPRTPHRGRYR